MRLRRYWSLAVLALIVGGGLVLPGRTLWPAPPLATSGSTWASGGGMPAIGRRETRPTLDPSLFVGKARLAHQVAREIPDILDQLYCYCECDKHLGHKSLLSCYTDGHAAT